MLPQHEFHAVGYNSHRPLAFAADHVKRKLVDEPTVLVGHSMGGILAAGLAHELPEQVRAVITISTPFGGSRAAAFCRWLPHFPPVLTDVSPSSGILQRLRLMKLGMPSLSIVTNGGALPTTVEPNDSIVTVSSQMATPCAKKVKLPFNHFEVLMVEKTVETVAEFLDGLNG